MSWLDVGYFGNMSSCFLEQLTENGIRYMPNPQSNDLLVGFERFKEISIRKNGTLNVTFAGKNRILEEDLERINAIKAYALADLYGIVKRRAETDDPVKDLIIWNQGDLAETHAPFSIAQKDVIEQALTNLPGVHIHLAVVKGVQPSFYSKGLVDSWTKLDIKSADGLSYVPSVNFMIVGETEADDDKKAELGFSNSNIIYFIGSDEQDKYMYTTDKNGKRKRTTGYKQLCELKTGLYSMMERKALHQPQGLAILERGDI